MKFARQIKLIAIAAIAVFTFAGCSGGSTSSGLGLSVGGGWSGILKINGAEYARFNMNIQQSTTDPEDPFSNKDLIGTFSSNNKCIGVGELTGTLVDSSISLKINDTLSMTGTSGNTNMSGSWSNSGEDCTKGGTWTASR